MPFAKLRELFGSGLLAENRDRGIARYEFDKKRYERDDGPNNEEKNEYATQAAEDSIPMLGLQDRAILAENKWTARQSHAAHPAAEPQRD